MGEEGRGRGRGRALFIPRLIVLKEGFVYEWLMVSTQEAGNQHTTSTSYGVPPRRLRTVCEARSNTSKYARTVLRYAGLGCTTGVKSDQSAESTLPAREVYLRQFQNRGNGHGD